MTTKEKLRQYIDYKGVSMRFFGKKINVSDSFLRSDGSVMTDKLPVIRNIFPDLNMDWLLFDEGEMIISDKKSDKVEEELIQYKTAKEVSIEYQFNVIYNKLKEIETFMEAVKLKIHVDNEIDKIESSLKKDSGK
ncbi:hypothetical protein V2647_03785 [Tenacibaculum maritimum]|uniref:hypothetical protein n=1 Tax=Tenacibaculum maritimum TaxID=107401 RepID=UPI0012E40578|nr:hypothetical protein [Tenacibaculum maritimum]CAA0150879.1 conserved hypothetical protein [Tenacibaculum maritimum]